METLKVNFDTQTVSARELYDGLSQEDGLKGTERFSKWFERYSSYGFTENEDYTSVQKSTEVQNNGGMQMRELQDYSLSVDMAKQICILQRTEKGKKIRQYLIELEKAWNTPEQIMARALKLADEKIHSLTVDVEEMKPKALFADAVSASHTSILIGSLAKLICQNGFEIGQKRLFQWLRDNGYLCKRVGNDWNMPMQRYVEQGLFEIKESTHIDGNGCNVTTKTPVVTGKGQVYFVNKFLSQAV